MASRPRSQQRTKRPPKRRATKKHVPGGTARGGRKRVAKKASKEKISTKKALKKQSSAKKASAGMVEAALAAFAHEVRTPLTGILAISDLLATSGLDERERRWVDTIKAGAEHLASLATLFVDAAKSASSSGWRPAGSVRPAGAGAQCRRLAGRPARRGERLALGGRDFGQAAGVGDRRSGSAARGAGKPDRQCGEIHRTGRGRAVGVDDSGRDGQGRHRLRGFRQRHWRQTLAEIKRLFRPFSQANVSIASRFGGAGLGLSSVKQLARAMGGDIVITPRRGGGTTFTLTVILATAPSRRNRREMRRMPIYL